ncbi:MAB_1171c family putative transporter [Streptomyces sp. NPDC059010]|uniref:MAB_1171c family putative transporter n=1 Tax=Streptomyces sp. NPDC059010 TaxID=3346695 RepID=UPI0036B91960
MSELLGIYGITVCLVLAWTVVRLARAPRDRTLWSLCGLITGWTISFPFGRAADHGTDLLGMSPMTSRLIEHALIVTGIHGLVCFYLYSALDHRRAKRRAWQYGIPLALTLAVLVVAALLTPAGVGTRDHRVTSVAVFFVAADSYAVFGFTRAWVWNRRYACGARPRFRRGLRLAAFGMIGIAVASALFVVAVALRWGGGGSAPQSLPTEGAAETALGWFAAVFFLLPGLIAFLVGVTYPSAVMHLLALRLWWRHLRQYRRLGPLWAALHERFPENALFRLPGRSWHEALNPRSVHRRYYRRVIECRDGLVRISPYLASLQGDADARACRSPAEFSARLRQALRASAESEPVLAAAIPIAVPDEPSLDADVRELIALSDALRTAQPNGGS